MNVSRIHLLGIHQRLDELISPFRLAEQELESGTMDPYNKAFDKSVFVFEN